VAGERYERIGRNQALLREVNEAIERGHWPARADEPVRFRCECSELDCNETIELTIVQYERLRDHPRRFVVVPGHQVMDAETVILSTDGYLVVEKQNEAGEVAEQLDPRP
jgi:hypothetical protein